MNTNGRSASHVTLRSSAVLSDTHTVFYSLAPMKRPEDICRHIFVKVGALDFMGILSELK